jgi:hypothetical protein
MLARYIQERFCRILYLLPALAIGVQLPFASSSGKFANNPPIKSMPSRPFAQDLRSPNPRKLLQKVVGFLNLLRSYLVQILTFSILSIAFLARKAISSGTVTCG